MMKIHTACVPVCTVAARSKLNEFEIRRLEKMGYSVSWSEFDKWHQVSVGSDFTDTLELEKRTERAIRSVLGIRQF